MEILKAAVFGIAQGLTEFFPVSSSGHLVIMPFIMNWDYIPVYYTVLLHFATLLALVTVFYREIGRIIKFFCIGIFNSKSRKNSYFRLAVFIIIATIPALIAGLLLNNFIEDFFSKPLYVAFFLLVTALFLFLGEFAGRRFENRMRNNNLNISGVSDFEETMNPGNIEEIEEISINRKKKIPAYFIALIIGLGQAVAIFPGISRSGSTISFARFFGVKRQVCVKFSLLMSVPVIFGAFVFELSDTCKAVAAQQSLTSLISMLVSFIFSYLSGLFAIKFLVKISRNKNFNFFALYCVILSIVVFILIFVRKI